MSVMQQLMTGLHGRIVKATGSLGGGTEDGSVLVLRHVGAKSGTVRETPLMFVHHNDSYAIVASNNGAPKHPGWYHNLQANPDTTITVHRKQIPVRARTLEGQERDEAWERFTALSGRWESYAHKTDRAIPIVALEPE